MGGMGKSEVCIKLFHEYNDADGKIKHIGWVVFDENLKKTLYGQFIETKEITDFEESFLHTKIHINQLSNKLLLFIDNMNEVSKEDELILGELACNIIITSRRNQIGNIKTIRIGELSEEECVSIYKEILERSHYEDEIVKEIVKKTAYLTLVVALLAKTAKMAYLTDEKLLKTLNEQGFNLSEIEENVDKDKQFNENLSELFDLSKIDENSEEFLLLKRFSLFPPQPLAFEYVKKWLLQKNFNILNNLFNKGWLMKTEIGFYMHPVISDVVQYKNKPIYEDYADLIKMLGDDLSFESTDICTERLLLLPFGEKVAQYFKEVEHENVANLIHSTARLYDYQGEYSKALEFYEKSLSIREHILGIEHLDTATTYNNMALAYNAQGDYDKALKLYDKTLNVYEKVFGVEHPNTALTYNNISLVYKAQGNYEKALDFCKKDLEISEKILGIEHPHTATSYHNMAFFYSNQGDYDKSLEFYKKVLAIKEKILGIEHPNNASTYNNMAFDYANQGDYDSALELFGKAFTITEKALGIEHPDTATTYNNIALVYYSQNEYDKALNFYEKSLAIREKILGVEHPHTATTYNNIALVYKAQGKYESALDLYVNSYRIFYNKFGADHPNSKRIKRNIDECYHLSDNTTEFETWLAEQLKPER